MSRGVPRELICAECGAHYSATYTSKTPRCPDCKHRRQLAQSARCNAAQRRATKENETVQAARRSQSAIATIAQAARKMNMTYGEYVARCGG